ncbi:MAG: ABC transporter ATP-binding protein, partial [Calditrichia bacterium]|nr:ABC transporter ATP-binding protein [Calditrichia bacterium]
LIILDEPTLGLDPLMQEVFYSILLEYRNNDGTVFFSSHNLTEVEKVCDRIAIIRNGNLVAVEKLEDLKKKRFRKLTVQFKKSMEDIKLSNSKIINKDDNEYTFIIKGSIEILLQELSQLPVKDFYFPKPDLEEVFMAYYNSEDVKV